MRLLRVIFRTLIGGFFYFPAEVQSVYSTVSADWAIGHSLQESYSSAEMQSVYSTVPADWAIGHSLQDSYSSAEMQSVYFSAATDLANKCIVSSIPIKYL